MMKFDGFDIAILMLWTGLTAFHAAALQFLVIRGEPFSWIYPWSGSIAALSVAMLLLQLFEAWREK